MGKIRVFSVVLTVICISESHRSTCSNSSSEGSVGNRKSALIQLVLQLTKPAITDLTRYLATASSDGTVKIWNVGGFTLEKTLTASSDSTARLWSMSTGENLKVYQGHHKATTCCALHDGAEPSS